MQKSLEKHLNVYTYSLFTASSFTRIFIGAAAAAELPQRTKSNEVIGVENWKLTLREKKRGFNIDFS